ncbi:MAG: SUMF1/EgtB/PvdO family nonheme iron enzyme [Myxococcales bacterium]|nr:SUMF1/EgtB/PvdO family nonheme iron enzyme [Myxococcales bacterium]
MNHDGSTRKPGDSGGLAVVHRLDPRGNTQQPAAAKPPHPASAPPSQWTPPQQFDEYVLVRLLGQGSMGRVYLARDTVLDRPVAVKFIGHVAPDADDRERFLVEARAVARLQHPNVVTIYRVGELQGHPYLITEYVAGKNLGELAVPLASRKVIELGVGLARGLAAAHRHGVLHRDIKLANVLLSDSGEVKLLDFSLAKLLDPGALDRPAPSPAPADAVRAATAAVQRHTGRHTAVSESDAALQAPSSSSERIQAGILSASVLSASTMPGAIDSSPHLSLTQAGTLLGTPHYMAPELWRSETATRRSDVYALGALLYILATGRPPTEAETTIELATRVQEIEPRPLLERASRADPRLAAIIDRCLRRDPFDRYASGEELLAALEALQPMGRELAVPEGNPYRGLQAFESKHRALFFGRAHEIRSVLARMRSDALVVVAGDSGVGKSSLCRAGVVPLVEEGNIDASRQWASATMTPGRYPRQTLIATLATLFDMTEETMAALLESGPEEFVRGLRKQLGDARGRLLMIDQLEELATLGPPDEVAVVGPLLARIASGLPGMRVLATVRGDFLTRVAQLPGVGDELARAIYFLRPLSRDGAREAIVGPARVKAVAFESEALVHELVDAGARGSLPLLQFALAELWEIRDQTQNVITAVDLKKIGGVTGALARHADAALAELIPEQRVAARRVLMRLVTVDDTRAVRHEDELTAGSPAAEAALKALVRARLVVVREVADQAAFEIAHEALIGGWTTLGAWLEAERETRAIHHRLELAVADWERLGRGRDGLWSGAPLQEVLGLDPASLRPRELEFIAACRAGAARTRVLKRVAAAAIPVAILLTYGGVWLKGQADLKARVDRHAAAAADALARVDALADEADGLRANALLAFDAGQLDDAEARWSRYLALLPDIETHMARAAQQLELGLGLASWRDDVREQLLGTLLRRAQLVEQTGRGALAVQDQLDRVTLHDPSGARLAGWNAGASLTVTSTPPGAHAFLEHYEEDAGRLRIARAQDLGITPLAPQPLERGSYRLRLDLPGHTPVVYPVLLERGEAETIDVVLPATTAIPDGFVYVAAGHVLYGTDAQEEIRVSFNAEPLHPVAVPAFLIHRHEVSFADYITFLDALPADRRAALLAATAESSNIAQLTELSPGRWQLDLHQGYRVYTVRSGEMLHYADRSHRSSVQWERLPVTGISSLEAREYVAWLDRSARVPGARLCSEHEWERAARGADNREFATGDRLEPDAANISTTYGRVPSAYGPDPVGSYPQSESPFGLYDTSGNVYEMTVSAHDPNAIVARGGAFFFDSFGSRIANRFPIEPNFRNYAMGLRVCATWPTAR